MVSETKPATTSEIDGTLAQRGARYGSFADNARFAQRLKALISSAPSWDAMTDYQREGIEMILFKMSRALTGDPTYRDNWHDIVGYAKLVDDLMAAEEVAAQRVTAEEIRTASTKVECPPGYAPLYSPTAPGGLCVELP